MLTLHMLFSCVTTFRLCVICICVYYIILYISQVETEALNLSSVCRSFPAIMRSIPIDMLIKFCDISGFRTGWQIILLVEHSG